jgi:hypothetical protein
VKLYSINSEVLARRLGASEELCDAVRKIGPYINIEYDPIDELRLISIKRNWMRITQENALRGSVSEMARWICSQAFVNYQYSAEEIIEAIKQCGLVNSSMQSVLDFSSWTVASMQFGMQPGFQGLDFDVAFKNTTELMFKDVVRRIELPFGCTAKSFIGRKGAHIKQIIERLAAHLHERFPELRNVRRLISFQFGTTAMMVTVRLLAIRGDGGDLKLFKPKVANEAFKALLLDLIDACQALQRKQSERSRREREKRHQQSLLEGRQYQRTVRLERLANACRPSWQRALTLPAAETEISRAFQLQQYGKNFTCRLGSFRKTILAKLKAQLRRQKALAEKRTTLLRTHRLLERQQKHLRGKAASEGDTSDYCSQKRWPKFEDTLADLCTNSGSLQPREHVQGIDVLEKTARRLRRQLKDVSPRVHSSSQAEICLGRKRIAKRKRDRLRSEGQDFTVC